MSTVEKVEVHAFTIPTEGPEGVEPGGTLQWESTTMMLVQVFADGEAGAWVARRRRDRLRAVARRLASLRLRTEAWRR